MVKINANQRYATDATSQAAFELACQEAEVPVQRFVSRTDLACGSTIGLRLRVNSASVWSTPEWLSWPCTPLARPPDHSTPAGSRQPPVRRACR